MESPLEAAKDHAFFTRLGFAFAVSIIVSGIMMVAVGPVPQDGEGAQIALNVQSAGAVAGR